MDVTFKLLSPFRLLEWKKMEGICIYEKQYQTVAKAAEYFAKGVGRTDWAFSAGSQSNGA
mgnify:FL=1